MWMLAVNHQNELWDPNLEVRGRTEGAEEVCNIIGKTTISTNQTPQSSQELKLQPNKTHGATHGSSCICSRGWPYLASMGGEALPWSFEGLMPHCRGIPKQGGGSGWLGEHHHRSRKRVDGVGGLQRGNWEGG